MAKKTENKPAFETRLGNVRVSVWKNSTENGEWYNIAPIRRYFDKEADEWKDSTTFSGLADLALLMEGLRMAREYVLAQAQIGGDI